MLNDVMDFLPLGARKSSMRKHFAQAFIPMPHAKRVAKQVEVWLGNFVLKGAASKCDGLFDFGDGLAIMTVTETGLTFRVAADDLLTFYGIQTVVQEGLRNLAAVSSGKIEWL